MFPGAPIQDQSDRSPWSRSVESRLARVLAKVTSQDIVDRAITAAKIATGVITLDKLAAEAWTAYTPTWTSTGTQPALGNGTLTGRYVRIGRTIIGNIYWQVGSTSTMGTGNYLWSLPVAQSLNQFAFAAVGVGKGYDASTGNNINTIATFYPGTQNLRLMYSATAPAGVETYVAQTTPWTWATSDDLAAQFMYEAAA